MAKSSFYENSPQAPGDPPAQAPGSPSTNPTSAPSSFYQTGSVVGAANANAQVYGLAIALPGLAFQASEWLFGHKFGVAVSFPENFSGSYAIAEVAATSAAEFSLKKNGTEFGTLTFTGTTGTFSASATNFAIGDLLEIVAPATEDDTLAHLSITLIGAQ